MNDKTYELNEVKEATLEFFNGDELSTSTSVDKYLLKRPTNDGVEYKELTPDDMHWRHANALAEKEKQYPNPRTAQEIYKALYRFENVVPGGSPMYGIGNPYVNISLSNCIVIESPEDSISGIIETGKDMANLFKARCGVGTDISSLRPDGALVNNSAGTSTGAWSFAEFYSNVCRMVGQNGRRGALMITMDIRHPDIEKFVIMKRDLGKVTGANISIMISDDFMNAVKEDTDWNLFWPVDGNEIKSKFSKTIKARDLWQTINESATQCAEPGLIFWDTYRKYLPANAYEEFKSICVNPCSEIALSPYDSCRLTSINLKYFVVNPFTEDAYFDFDRFKSMVKMGMRIMDDIVDLEIDCLRNIIAKLDRPEEILLWEKLVVAATNGRRTGLGTHGLADCLARLCLKYDTFEAQNAVDAIYVIFRDTAYNESVDLAIERGPFPVFDWETEKYNAFIQNLPDWLKEKMAKHGRRNISLLTMAPTGSVSIVSQTSSGIEPVFMNAYIRRKKINPSDPNPRIDMVDDRGDKWTEYFVFHHNVMDYLAANPDTMEQWRRVQEDMPSSDWSRELEKMLPDYFITSHEIDPMRRVEIQGVIQKYIDHGISSCVTGDTLIQTDKGLFEINELASDTKTKCFAELSGNLSSVNIDGKKSSITETYNNGISDVVKVRCKNDYELISTPNHKMVVLNEQYEQVWKQVSDIKVGDVLVGRIGLRLFNDQASKYSLEYLVGKPFVYSKSTRSKDVILPKYMTLELSRLLGYLCSDGSVTPNGISLSQVKNNVCDDFADLVKNIFGLTSSIQEDSRSEGLVSVVVNSRELRAFFMWLGICNHNDISIPLVIRKSGLGVAKEFIKGATLDGYISKDCIGVLTTVSYRYAKQMQSLLLNIGFDARVTKCHDADEHIFPDGNMYSTQDGYCVHLSNAVASKFIDMIGFAEDRKNEYAISTYKRSSRIKVKGEIPDNGLRLKFRQDILPNIKSNRLYEFFHSMTCLSKQGMFLNRESVQEMADMGLEVPDYLIDDTYIFRQVTKIESQEPQQTYDLSVPDGNSYLANGFVSHNTINCPVGTTVENVQAIYEKAWECGLKGVTVYVDGSRSGVLVSKKDDKPRGVEESFSPKRPRELPCDIHHSQIDGKKWIMLVGTMDGIPYEIFGGSSEHVIIPKKYVKGKVVKRKCDRVNAKGRYNCYDLIVGDDEDPLIIQDIVVTFNSGDYAANTRATSLMLRHGIPVQIVAEQWGRDQDSSFMSFSKVLARVLRKYVVDGATSGETCEECGSKLRFESGCVICPNCGASPKCS